MKPELVERMDELIKLVPQDPPEGVVEAMLGRGYLQKSAMVYSAEWVSLPTGKVKMVKIHCSKCGGEAYATHIQADPSYRNFNATYGYIDPVYNQEVHSGMSATCPCCGEYLTVYHKGRVGSAGINLEFCKVPTLHNIDGSLCVLKWGIDKFLNNDGTVRFEVYGIDGIVVVDKKR